MGRGPSYPFVDLEEAIGLTKKIYDYAKRSAAASDAVVEHALKYSLKSSGGIKTIAALKAFGLIEESEGNKAKTLKISDRAYRILVDDVASPERIQAVKDAALSPKWYEYCWKKWGASPPPSMRSTLILEHGFIPSTVDAFMRDYRKTLEYAGIGPAEEENPAEQDGSGSGSQPFNIGDYVQWESQGVLRMPAAKKLTHYSPDGKFGFVEGSFTGIPADQLIAGDPPEQVTPQQPALRNAMLQVGYPNMRVETFSLSDGITVNVQWPSSITQDAFEDLGEWLELLKKKIGRAVNKPQDKTLGTKDGTDQVS